MSTVTNMLDDLVSGQVSLSGTVQKFEAFDWAQPAEVSPADLELPPPAENSFDEVQFDSRLTVRQYAQLAAAYRRAVGGEDGT